MQKKLMLPLLCGMMAYSCSFEFRPASPWEGVYELTDKCQLNVGEKDVNADCELDGIKVKVLIEPDKVKFETLKITSKESNTECWVSRTCVESWTGDGEWKEKKAAPYKGRFGKLGGKWEGKMTVKTSCNGTKATGAPSYCKDTVPDISYTYKAEVKDNGDAGDTAKIDWTSSTGAKGSFDAIETKTGVRVAGKFYKRVGAKPPPSTDGSTPPKDTAGGKEGGSPDKGTPQPDKGVTTPDKSVPTPDKSVPTPDKTVTTPDLGQKTG
jgi:hypothetical protein